MDFKDGCLGSKQVSLNKVERRHVRWWIGFKVSLAEMYQLDAVRWYVEAQFDKVATREDGAPHRER